MSEEDFDAGVYDDEEPFPWDLERDWRRKAAKADIPVFLVHGVNDNAARIPAIDWFRWRRGDIDNRDKAWIGQWDHGSNTYPNDRTCPQHVPTPCDNDQWTLALHAWFDKHLKRKDVPTGPKVEVFLNNRTVYQPTEWPPRRENRWRRFFFHPDGKLVRGKKPEDVTSASFVGNPDGEVLEYTEETPNSLAWTSKPFKDKALLASVPTLRLFESQTVSRMHIITTLYDINKQGEVTCVLVRPKTSADAERCGISKASFAMQPELRDGVREQVPVVPGDPMKLNMVGMDQAWVIKPGHRIRIVVATSQPDKVATHSEGTVTVYMGGNQASRVALPIIYNARLRKDTFHN
jgi:predicted acyl esterase